MVYEQTSGITAADWERYLSHSEAQIICKGFVEFLIAFENDFL